MRFCLVFSLLGGLLVCGPVTATACPPKTRAGVQTVSYPSAETTQCGCCAANVAQGALVVSYPSAQTTLRGLLHRPAGKGPFPALLLVHDDSGVTDWVKEQGRRLADKGYVTLVVDLYRGRLPSDLMDAHILSRGLPQDQVEADLKAAAAYLAGRADVKGEALGILGWGLGGGYALDAARHDARLRAVVVCYGRLITDARLLAPLNAPVLGLFGAEDQGISAQTIEQFRAAMRKAGKRVVGIHMYPDCRHGFMGPPGPTPSGAASSKAASDAWNQIERFLAAELSRK